MFITCLAKWAVFFCCYFFYIFLFLQSCLPNLPSLNLSVAVIPFFPALLAKQKQTNIYIIVTKKTGLGWHGAWKSGYCICVSASLLHHSSRPPHLSIKMPFRCLFSLSPVESASVLVVYPCHSLEASFETQFFLDFGFRGQTLNGIIVGSTEMKRFFLHVLLGYRRKRPTPARVLVCHVLLMWEDAGVGVLSVGL